MFYVEFNLNQNYTNEFETSNFIPCVLLHVVFKRPKTPIARRFYGLQKGRTIYAPQQFGGLFSPRCRQFGFVGFERIRQNEPKSPVADGDNFIERKHQKFGANPPK